MLWHSGVMFSGNIDSNHVIITSLDNYPTGIGSGGAATDSNAGTPGAATLDMEGEEEMFFDSPGTSLSSFG